MVDDNPNIIKPVDGLQNIAGLAPARRREQRNRRHDLNKGNEEEVEQELSESVDEETAAEETGNHNDDYTIDYRA